MFKRKYFYKYFYVISYQQFILTVKLQRTLDDETDRLEKLKLEKNMLQVKHDDILAQMQNHISDKEKTSDALKSLQCNYSIFYLQ